MKRKQTTPAAEPRFSTAQADLDPVLLAGEGSGESRAPLPQVSPQPPFLYCFHPNKWHVSGGEVLPELGTIPLQPGLNGVTLVVTRGRDGTETTRVNASRAIQRKKERGWEVIPQDVDKDQGFPTYLRKLPVGDKKTGITSYVSRWEHTPSGSSLIVSDEKGFNTWRRSLIERGILPEPSIWALESLYTRTEELWGQVADKAQSNPSMASRRDKLAEDLKVISRALEKARAKLPNEGELVTSLDNVEM